MSGSSPASAAESPDPRVAAGLALVTAVFFFVGLGDTSVVNADEAIYHGIAERMAETGDLFHLDYRGEPRVYDTFLNAPLHYWARAGLITLLGSSPWTMRALSALGAILAVLATYGLGTRLLGRRAGLAASLLLGTTFHFVYLHGARTGEVDTLVTAEIALAAWAFLRAVEDGRSFVPHHLAVAALLMTKAPLVLVVALSELVWFAAREESRPHLRRYLLSGLAALPLALAWHAGQAIAYADRVGDILGTVLGHVGGGDPDFEPLGFFGNLRFYAGVLLYGGFPHSLVFPLGLAAVAMRPRERVTYAAVFVAVLLVFFGLVAKHYAWYVMPAYPFLAILVAHFGREIFARGAAHPLAWGLAFVAAALPAIDVGLWSTNPFAVRALLYPMEIGARELAGIGPWAWVGGVGTVLALGLLWARQGDRLRGPALGVALVVLLAGLALPRALAPLRHVGHQSELAQANAELRARLAEGEALAAPLRIQNPPLQLARFYFGEDFELVPAPGREGTDVLLYPRGAPRVLDRSIGRVGLEQRLPRERARRLEGRD
jgi:4-amino-4-deoxy-L-arabinose transferase-like glycosyltransferase